MELTAKALTQGACIWARECNLSRCIAFVGLLSSTRVQLALYRDGRTTDNQSTKEPVLSCEGVKALRLK